MKRTLTVAAVLMLLVPSWTPARDKKDVERIAALEKRVAELESSLESVDDGTSKAFRKVGQIVTGLTQVSEDLDFRVSKLEGQLNLRTEGGR